MQRLPPVSGILHTDEEWEKIKPAFIQVYQVQSFPLPMVRSFLAEKYGFHATLRQYKTRIKKWELYKKDSVARDRTRAIATTQKKRATGEQAIGEAPGGLVQHRYRTATISRSPEQPGHYGAVYAAIYGVGRFHLGILNVDLDRLEIRSQSDGWVMRRFYDTGKALSTFAAASNWKEVQSLYGQLLGFAAALLRERNPIVVVCIIQMCCKFIEDGQTAVIQRFLGFLVDMANAQGQSSHPLCLVFSAWRQSGEHFSDLLTLCSRRTYDILTETLGTDHPQALSASRALYTTAYVQRDYPTALRAFNRAAEIERKLYPGSVMFHDLLRAGATCLLAMQDLEGAASMIEEMADTLRIAESIGIPENQRQRSLACQLMLQGELSRLKGDSIAISHIEDALRLNRLDVGVRNAARLRFLEMFLEIAKSSLKSEARPEPVHITI